jgi:GMP reductase
MIIDTNPKLDFCDVLIVPTESDLECRKQVSLSRSFSFRWSTRKITTTPIVAANMHKVGTLKLAYSMSEHNMMTCLSKHIDTDMINRFIDSVGDFSDSKIFNKFIGSICFSLGTRGEDIDRVFSLMKNFPQVNVICIDVANGYCRSFKKFINDFRKDFKDKIIIAGNVVTSDQACKIIDAGADIVKIGIGSGSVCTTRKITGIGYPQFSAIMEIQKDVHSIGGFLMSDGGCQVPGDICKAFAAGADFVMLGGILAGHEECVHSNEDCHMTFYGMSSDHAMKSHYGQIAEYRASEGKVVKVNSRGSVSVTLKEILGGMRSCCTYLNCENIEKMPHNSKFVIVNRQLNGMFS